MKKLFFFLIAVISFIACNNSSGWSAADRNDLINSCTQGATQNMGAEKAKAYCTCMQQKLEVKFPNPKDAGKITAETMQTPEMKVMVASCLGGDNTNNNNPTGNPLGNPNGNTNNNNTAGNWTQAQHDQYVQGCAATAQQSQGMTSQQAISYCDCMTRKVEQKYSFDEAARLTSADLQTEEWMRAADECRSQVRDQ